MSGTIWTKFFWSDWQTEPALRVCSYAARGLWMDMLCIAAAHDPIGYVAVAGRGLDETDIARMTGGSESEVRALLGELDRNGVFSRDRRGRIYSRRMVNDARKAATARKNGKFGGNPALRKDKENSASDNPSDNGGDNTHKPYAMSQESEGSDDPSLSGARARPSDRKADEPIPEGFPTAEDVGEAEGWIREAGVTLSAAEHARRFRNHARTNDRRVASWPDAWRMWIEIEISKAPKAPTSTLAAKPAEPWKGPPEVACAVEFCMGVYAATYLGQCAWQDVPEKALTTTSRTAYDRIRRDAGADLARLGIKIILSEGRAA